MSYHGPFLSREFPGFGPDDHVLTAHCRAVLEEHLPKEGADAVEVACLEYFWMREPEDDHEIAGALEEVAIAASRLQAAYERLPRRALHRLLAHLDRQRAGRLLLGGRSAYFAGLHRIINRPLRGSRLLGALIDGVAGGADEAANEARIQAVRQRPGRPVSTDWEIAMSIAAVCLTFGVTPSERSRAFMEIMEAVWQSVERDRGPLHAIRTMRMRLRERTSGGELLVLNIPLIEPALGLSVDAAGRMRCVLLSKKDAFALGLRRGGKGMRPEG